MSKVNLNLVKKFAILVISCILIGQLLLLGVFSIPVDRIEKNVRKSIETFKVEGVYPEVFPWCTSYLDNYTDALMLQSAIYDGSEDLVNKSIMVYREEPKDSIQPESLIRYFEEKNVLLNLRSYPRYWHGYLIILKPLLCFFDYPTIRLLNLLVQIFVNIVLIVLLYKKKMGLYIIPYILMLCSGMPIAIAFSIQYSAVFYIFSIGSIVLVLKNESWKSTYKHMLFFAILGILTSYFDLLTYPFVTFGIPITFYFCLNYTDKIKENLFTITKYVFCWGIGYGGMWSGKWIIATLLTKSNIIKDAIEAVQMRTSMDIEMSNFSVGEVFKANVETFLHNPIICCIILYVIIAIVCDCHWGISLEQWKYRSIFLVIAMLPFFWYYFVSNHSMVHNKLFTYRELMIFVFALMCMFIRKPYRELKN